jgi:hypothetical protein
MLCARFPSFSWGNRSFKNSACEKESLQDLNHRLELLRFWALFAAAVVLEFVRIRSGIRQNSPVHPNSDESGYGLTNPAMGCAELTSRLMK